MIYVSLDEKCWWESDKQQLGLLWEQPGNNKNKNKNMIMYDVLKDGIYEMSIVDFEINFQTGIITCNLL